MAGHGMTADELVEELVRRTHLEPEAVKRLLGEFTRIAMGETNRSGEFLLPGIGRLVKFALKPRLGRNPITGEAVRLPERAGVRLRLFKAAEDAAVAQRGPSAVYLWCPEHGPFRSPPPCPLGSHRPAVGFSGSYTPDMEPQT